MKTDPVVLEGRFVRLEPLAESHHRLLCELGFDPGLWLWIAYRVTTPEEMIDYIRAARDAQVAGTALPFAMISRFKSDICLFPFRSVLTSLQVSQVLTNDVGAEGVGPIECQPRMAGIRRGLKRMPDGESIAYKEDVRPMGCTPHEELWSYTL